MHAAKIMAGFSFCITIRMFKKKKNCFLRHIRWNYHLDKLLDRYTEIYADNCIKIKHFWCFVQSVHKLYKNKTKNYTHVVVKSNGYFI